MRPLKMSALVVLFGSSICPAQTSGPATSQSPTTRTAISKACSDQANAQGLHGKKRKAFRAKCKQAGGKPS
jgi:hypothetical protein